LFSRSTPEADKQGLPSVQKIPEIIKGTQETKYKDILSARSSPTIRNATILYTVICYLQYKKLTFLVEGKS
jgi:hypothetical protein